MDEKDITGPIAVPNTGGWQIWETVLLEDISLSAGEHIMKIVFDTDYTNLNYLVFSDLVTSTASSIKTELEVYPNPFSSEGFKINSFSKLNYRITDLTGFEVEEGNGSGSLRAGAYLNAGVYILTIETGSYTAIYKIIRD